LSCASLLPSFQRYLLFCLEESPLFSCSSKIASIRDGGNDEHGLELFT
jgi:hypothetical protein